MAWKRLDLLLMLVSLLCGNAQAMAHRSKNNPTLS
jgi:hypothetical protein